MILYTCPKCDEPLDKDPCRECNRVFLAQRIKPNFVSKRKPKTNADKAWCKPCQYRATSDDYLCNYYVATGKRRGCHYGNGCEKRVRRKVP